MPMHTLLLNRLQITLGFSFIFASFLQIIILNVRTIFYYFNPRNTLAPSLFSFFLYHIKKVKSIEYLHVIFFKIIIALSLSLEKVNLP